MSDIVEVFEAEEDVSTTETSEAAEVEQVETDDSVAVDDEHKESSEEKTESEATKVETKEESETTAEEDFNKMAPWAQKAVKDERRKRQELEAQLKELQSKNSEQVEQEKTPDVFEDQEAFVESIRKENQANLSNLRIEIAREMMIEAHNDYEEMEAAFIEAAKQNPILASEAQKARNPAKFAYEQAKKLKDFNSMQDINAVKEQMRAEIRKEIEIENSKKQEEHAKKAGNLSPSLTNVAGSSVKEKSFDTIESLFDD